MSRPGNERPATRGRPVHELRRRGVVARMSGGVVLASIVLMLLGTGGAGLGPAPGAAHPPLRALTADASTLATHPSLGYTERFLAPYLNPSHTFSFNLDQSSYSAAGGGSVLVTGLSAGPHLLTNVTATPTTAGWATFGRSDVGNPTLVPENPVVNLTFAEVNVSAPLGIVHFHEDHIPFGTVWQLSFNGTVFSSLTTWINVSTHPGLFPVAPKSVTSSRATTIFRALPFQPAFSVVPGSTYELNFSVQYAVQVLGSAGGSVVPFGTTWWSPGSNLTIRANGANGSAFGTWTGVGSGSYSGPEPRRLVYVDGPIVETASFWTVSADRFNLRFQVQGLPNGTQWTAYVDGRGYGSPGTVLVVPSLLQCVLGAGPGLYNISIPPAFVNTSNPGLGERFVPSAYPGSVCGGSFVFLNFSAEFLVDFGGGSGGTVAVSDNGVPLAPGSWVPAGDALAFTATPSPGFDFLGWTGMGVGSYSGPESFASFLANGSVRESAQFAVDTSGLAPVYPVSFQASGPFLPGTIWSVSVNGQTYAATSNPLTVPDLAAGSYPVTVSTVLSPDGLTEYLPHPSALQLTVPAAAPVNVQFNRSFWVAVSASGPATLLPGSGWVPVNTTVSLSASSNDGSDLQGWVGSGAGAYTGNALNPTVLVGGPISEVAVFGAIGASVASAPPIGWIAAFAATGLLVGLAIGWVLLRRPRSTSPGPTEAPPPPRSEP